MISDFLPLRKIGQIENTGFLLDAAGNLTFGIKISSPEIFDLSTEKTFEIFKNIQLFLDNPLVPHGSVLHQQDFYFAKDFVKEEKHFYSEQKWQEFFGQRKIFVHERFLFLTYPHAADFPKPHLNVLDSISQTKEKMENYQNHALTLLHTLQSFLGQNKSVYDCKTKILSQNALQNLVFGAYLNRDFSVFEDLEKPMEKNYYMYPFLKNEKGLIQKLSDINIISLIEEGETTNFFRKSNIQDTSEIENDPQQAPIFNKSRVLPLSQGFAIGLGLPINHIVNTKIIKLSQQYTQKNLTEQTKKIESALMFSTLFKQKSAATVKHEALQSFGEEIQKDNKTAVYLQQNVVVWHPKSDKQEKLIHAVCGAYGQLGLKFTLEDKSTAPLFFQNAAGGGAWGQNRFLLTTADRAVAYLPLETHETGDPKGVAFLGTFGNPVHLDFRYNKHLSNYNMLVLGGSGKGKSVFTNHILQHHINQKNICFLFDKGGSYEYLVQSNGGLYINTSKKENLSFSPFLIAQDDLGTWLFEDENFPERAQEIAYEKEKIMRILEHIFMHSSSEKKEMSLSERNVFLRLLADFYEKINAAQDEKILPSMTAFYVFCKEQQNEAKNKNDEGNYLISKAFTSFLMAAELFVGDNIFCKKGEYFFLLNAEKKRSLVGNQVIAIDLQAVSENPVLYALCMTLFLDAVQFTIEHLPADIFKAVVIDEGIDMFVSGGKESKFIGTAARKIRKHGGGLTLIIQHLKIFETMPANVAGDLEENLAIKVVLGMDSESEKTAHILSERLGMDEMDLEKIRSLDPSTSWGREYYIKMGRKGYLVRLFLPEALLLMYSTTPELLELKKKMYSFYEGDVEKIIDKLIFWQKKYKHESEKQRYLLMKEELERVMV